MNRNGATKKQDPETTTQDYSRRRELNIVKLREQKVLNEKELRENSKKADALESFIEELEEKEQDLLKKLSKYEEERENLLNTKYTDDEVTMNKKLKELDRNIDMVNYRLDILEGMKEDNNKKLDSVLEKIEELLKIQRSMERTKGR